MSNLMNNLFSIFDPSSSFNLSTNWLALLSWSLIFCSLMISTEVFMGGSRFSILMNQVLSFLSAEFITPMAGKASPYLIFGFLVTILFTSSVNFFGLTPYTFTPTSSISFTLSMALSVWLFIELTYFVKALSSFLSHLVPSGTPSGLIPLMVLIELVSNFIRPITLSVRLAANMVAGHLLISLTNSGSVTIFSVFIFVAAGVTLFFLEIAVAFIQGYVFTTLSLMYTSELDSCINI